MSERDGFVDAFGERRGAPPERPGFCAPPPELSTLERLREFTNDVVRFEGTGEPDHLAQAHGFALAEGKWAGSRGSAPVSFLHEGGADGSPSVRALLVSYPGQRPGTLRRRVLFMFDSEAT